MAENIIFQPVRGTEELIGRQPVTEGFVYFAYDTGNIYIDKNGGRYLMGGSATGIVYANGNDSSIVKDDSGDSPEGTYIISAIALENPAVLPQPDTLILNSDGRFFRVISSNISTQIIVASLIAVSGTGGGGGIGPVIIEDLAIVPNTSTIGGSFTYVYKQNYNAEVTVNCTSGDDEVELVVEFYANNDINSTPVYTIVKRGAPANEPIQIDMGEVDYIGTGLTVLFTATAANSKMVNGVTRRFNNIRFVDMHIDKHADSNFISIQQDTELQLRYVPYGKGLNVQLHTAVDGAEIPNNIRLIDDNMGHAQTIAIPVQNNGTHTIELWLSTEINGAELLSSPIFYEASWSNGNNEIPLIWIGETPDVVVKYENAIIKYAVFDPVAELQQATTTVDFYQNKKLIGSEEVRYSNSGWLEWDVTALYVEGLNNFMIRCGSTAKTITFEVTTEGSRDLSLVNQTALIMNFDTMGRTNTEIKSSRGLWKSQSRDYTANLLNFNWYNNGWNNDNNGFGSYLSIANGASVSIPFGNIVLGSAAQPWTFEIRFRIRNAHKYATLVTEIPKYVYFDAEGRECVPGEEKTEEQIIAIGGTIKLDEDGNRVMNEANTTEKIVETVNNVAMKYLNNDNYGFCIGTQEAYFRTPGKTVNVRYKENEIINISFVVDKVKNTLSIYLNGILSGAADLNNINSFTMENIPFLMNSSYCDFDVYKFRVYNIALTMPEIIHNYLADIKSITLYDQNQLTDVNDATKLSYAKLVEYNREHPEAPSMPYAVIDSSGTPNDDELPHFKGGNKLVTVTFVNPVADKLLADGEISEYEYYTHCPSYTATNVDINVQGTSSQKYPRRNFKLKFKKAKNWNYTQGSLKDQSIAEKYTLNDGSKIGKKWHMDSENLATNKFTWKIDYMESSGSYNTGFANLLGNNIYNKHPLDDLNIDGLDTNDYRTSVYGFPMLVFHKRADGNYTYIGRYNMNLDKGSNEYYGFEDEYEQPYVNAPWDEELTDGTVIHHEHPLIADIAECWELRDNQGTWCSFRYPTDDARANGFRTLTADSTVDRPKLEAGLHFEARYHKMGDEIEAAREYNPRLDDNDFTRVIGDNNSAICSWLYNKMSNLEALFTWLDSTDTSKVDPENLQTLSTPVELEVNQQIDDDSVTYSTRTENGIEKTFGLFTKDTVEYRRQKFRTEFSLHLDKHYCTIYFIMTELLLCYDSRGKNMMIATFGPTANSQGNYVWYPIFYDIDTQLGLNNVGALLWDYDEDATENRTFSTGNSVLWENFANVFKSDIIATYQELRKTKVTYQNIEGAYTCNPNVFTSSYAMRGVRPIVAIGLDEYYKYILPVTEKWKMQDGTYGTANYLYACQGDRILSRELLINNRLLYLDSKWHGGDFTVQKTMSGISFRLSGNKPDLTSDKYVEKTSNFDMEGQEYGKYPVPYFDAVPTFNVTPYLNFYLTTFIDEKVFANTEPYRASINVGGMSTSTDEDTLASYKSGVVDEQLNYFCGSDYISSVGDLSINYPSEVHYTQGNRLLDITLGSDIPGYFNDKLTADSAFELGTGANENTKPLLEKIILTNLRKLNRFIDASNARKLQEFRALNTLITYVTFADGAPLRIVHLPISTNQLKFIQNKNLTKIIRSSPVILDMVEGVANYRDSSTYEGLYIEGATDYDYTNSASGTGSNINIIEFEGDAMGYDSYELLRNIVKQKTGTNGRLKIRMADVTWTPYTPVEYGELKQSGVNYKYLTDHSTYIDYEAPDDDWDNDTLQGRIFTFDPTLNRSIISDLSLLDQFLEDYDSSITNGVINQFTNNNENTATQATRPALSGRLHVANINGEPISESLLTSKYGVWGDLKITADKVTESYICKFVEIDDTGKEKDIEAPTRYDPSDYTNQTPVITSRIPSKPNYTFKGWSIDREGTSMAITYDMFTGNLIPTTVFTNNVFTSENTVITYYAVYEIQQFGIKVYNSGESELIVLDSADPKYILNDDDQIEQVTILVNSGDTFTELPIIPYKDDSGLVLEQTYKFIGYSTISEDTWTTDSRGNIVLRHPAPTVITRDITIYAQFMQVSVYDNVLQNPTTGEPYYTIKLATDSRFPECTGKYEIHFNPNRTDLKGKITLPKQGYDEQGILRTIEVVHNRFGNEAPIGGITHIFFERGSQVSIIGQQAFLQWQNLKFIKLPNYNTIIGNSGINQITNFFEGISQEDLDDFFSKISVAKEYAFNRTGIPIQGKSVNLSNIVMSETSAFRFSRAPGSITFGSQTNFVDVSGWKDANIQTVLSHVAGGGAAVSSYTLYLASAISEEDSAFIFGSFDAGASVSILTPQS